MRPVLDFFSIFDIRRIIEYLREGNPPPNPVDFSFNMIISKLNLPAAIAEKLLAAAFGFIVGVVILRTRSITRGIEDLFSKPLSASSGFFLRLLAEDSAFIALRVLDNSLMASVFGRLGYIILIMGIIRSFRR